MESSKTITIAEEATAPPSEFIELLGKLRLCENKIYSYINDRNIVQLRTEMTNELIKLHDMTLKYKPDKDGV